jgi:hypothetical protein
MVEPDGFSPVAVYGGTMARGILDTIGLAGSVLFAAPVALYGADLLVRGQTVMGTVFLAIATLMILVPRYVRTPKDVAADAVTGTTERLVESEDGEESQGN